MSSESRRNAVVEESASYWKGLYERQSLFINSINALLERYGKTVELKALYREFLLTIMGQYVVAQACYFQFDPESGRLAPTLCYGGCSIHDLDPFEIDPVAREFLQNNQVPLPLHPLHTALSNVPIPPKLSEVMDLCCSVGLKNKLVGMAFLGKPVSGKRHTEFELRLLGTMCGISAVTFNNARLYENARVSMQEVKRLFDIRTEMIDRVSHEFRTPMTVIKAGLEVARPVSDATPVFDNVLSAVARLEELIASLLKLDRKYQKSVGNKESLVSVSTIIHEVISDCEKTAYEKSVRFRVRDTLAGAIPGLTVSRADFKTVVSGLITNAVEFASESTVIEIELGLSSRKPDESVDGTILIEWENHAQAVLEEYAEIGGGDGTRDETTRSFGKIEGRQASWKSHVGPYVVLRVTNAGMGIPKDEIEHLAEPFRQASNSPHHGVKGRGLALAVATRILSDGRGALCCKSSLGGTTTFSMFLPLV
jgi:signal transduction histidine kinase